MAAPKRKLCRAILGSWTAGALALSSAASAQTFEWTGGASSQWVDPANWNPAGLPDLTSDADIGALTADGDVSLAGNGRARNLFLANGMELTVGSPLALSGLQVARNIELRTAPGATRPTRLRLFSSGSVVTNGLFLQGGSILELLQNTRVTVDAAAGVDAQSAIVGHGTLLLDSGPSTLRLDGRLAPAAGATLRIANPTGKVVDLDGTGTTARLDVSAPGSRLQVEGPLSDPFSGELRVGAGSVFEHVSTSAFRADGAIFLDSTATDSAQLQASGLELAGTLTADGTRALVAADSVVTGRLVVPNAGDTLRILGDVRYVGGQSLGAGTLRHNGSIEVSGLTDLRAGVFDWDGGEPGGQQTRVLSGAQFIVRADRIESTVVPGVELGYDGDVVVEAGGAADIRTTAPWVLAGDLTLNGTATQAAALRGSAVLQRPGSEIAIDRNGVLPDTTVRDRLRLNATPGSGETVQLRAGRLVLESGSQLELVVGTNATIQADDFVLAGNASVVDNTLRVETPTPWRLEGRIRSSGGRSVVEGSAFRVGSATGPATLDATESLTIASDVVLESTATVEAELGVSGALGEIEFTGRTTLQGAAFNPAAGPWTPGGGLPQPSRIGFAGDVATEADTTVVAGSLRLNDRFTPAPQRITIDPTRTLAFDARSLTTSPLTSLDVGAGATFDVVIRDPTAPTWTNQMTITLGGGGATLRSTPFVHEGQLLGSGTIDGSFTGSGFVAPGLSPGLLQVTGDVELGPGATLAFEIG
ncbi:MAG: hypothetical protein MJE66_07745, partial [Proteobacteria bacterium]|nr:hypothetical protein [Pseudomonadota bacterium]